MVLGSIPSSSRKLFFGGRIDFYLVEFSEVLSIYNGTHLEYLTLSQPYIPCDHLV